ncbi:hypothetical protein ALQ38_05532 [Pseudomonas marginalis pv. marginalis]|nr:hypothetical protein ALQ38_05532 [Pseudomonas marginalis pv. marginalis]
MGGGKPPPTWVLRCWLWRGGQQEAGNHRKMVGNTQRILLAHLRLHPLDPRAVEQVVQRAVGPVHARVVGEVGQPFLTVNPAGLAIARDHRVLVPQQMQLAVRRILPALAGVQAQELPQGQQVEIAPDQPGRATAFEFIQQLDRGFYLFLHRTAPRAVTVQAGIEHGQLATVAQRQVGQQQGGLGLELAADDIGFGRRQLQAFGVLDLVAAQCRQLATDAAEDMPVGNKVGLPVEGLDAAGVEVDQALLQQGKLVLVMGGLGVFVEFLQQQDVGLFIANHPCHFVEAGGHVFHGGTVVRATAVGGVVPEHVVLAGQVLDVPGHDLERLPRQQRGRTRCNAAHRQGFLRLGAPGQAVDQGDEQACDDQQAQQGDAQ